MSVRRRSVIPSPLEKPLWRSQFIDGLRVIRPRWSESELTQVAERWMASAGMLLPTVALALFIDMKRTGEAAVRPLCA